MPGRRWMMTSGAPSTSSGAARWLAFVAFWPRARLPLPIPAGLFGCDDEPSFTLASGILARYFQELARFKPSTIPTLFLSSKICIIKNILHDTIMKVI